VEQPDSAPPGIAALARQMLATALSALHTRGELFITELEEEKTRVVELLIWAMAAGFLGMMFLALLTGVVIFLFPRDLRIYAGAGFCLLYLAGAIVALLNLKALIKTGPPPFNDTINELKKDRACLESSR
jgi:uncharacterized membrane protein YqjE